MTPVPASARNTRRGASLGLLGLFGLFAGARFVQAQTAAPERNDLLAQQVKAAYIYNFGGFVEWPAQAFAAPDSPLQIGVMEADALADLLTRTAAGRTVHGRPLMVRKLRRTESTVGIHLLFIGSITRLQLIEVLAAARRQPTLLVTEAEAALTLGSMINFVVADERLRFEIAPKNAERSGLSISARLLAAALQVEGKAP